MKLVKESLVTESNYPAFTGNVEGTLVIRHNVDRSIAREFVRYLNGNEQRIKESGGIDSREPKVIELANKMNMSTRQLAIIVSDEFDEIYDELDENYKPVTNINERLYLDGGTTWIINMILFITAFMGTFLLKSIGAHLAWIIIGIIMTMYGYLASTLGMLSELNYGDFIEEFADRKKTRELRKNPERIKEVGNMVEDAILTNPNIKRGHKAHITSLQNHLAEYIEQKDWRSIRNKLNEIINYLKRLEEDEYNR